MGQMKVNQTQAELLDGQKPWVKLTRVGSIEMARLIGESARGAKLFASMFAVMDDENSIVATHETLSELADMPLSTLRRAITDLTDRALIEVLHIQKRGAAHVYRINERVVWSGRGPKGRAVIKARVFLRGEDQARPEQVGQPQPELPTLDAQAMFVFRDAVQPEGYREPHATLDQPDLESLMRKDD